MFPQQSRGILSQIGREIVSTMNDERIEYLRFLARVVLILMLVGICARSAAADQIHCLDHNEKRPVYYNDPSQVSLVRILAPPPAAGSEAAQKDARGVLKAQAKSTPERIQNAKDDVCESVFRFDDVMGPGFTPDKLPFANGFFERVFFDSDREIRIAKDYFKRERPFVTDPRVKLMVEQSTSYSYPSGHSTFAYTVGIILADMVPEKAVQIFQRADIYAGNRAIVGVHYPGDILAGRISAAVIDNAFFHNNRFLTDYARARAEVREALGLK
jgi:acid phosphatase (class A)